MHGENIKRTERNVAGYNVAVFSHPRAWFQFLSKGRIFEPNEFQGYLAFHHGHSHHCGMITNFETFSVLQCGSSKELQKQQESDVKGAFQAALQAEKIE